MRAFKLLLPVVLLVVCISVLQSDTIHVPADSSTIQAGINGAVDGDTVLVADGTYTGAGNRDIDFWGKAIVVMSENGAESCIIDCDGSEGDPHRGFYFHNGEDSNSVLQGFTITNGYIMGAGGGINCYYGNPTITGNTISGNTAYNSGGGGIYCWYNSSPIITGNTITGNEADDLGGGICCEASAPTITGNTITENTADNGGGIFLFTSSPTITDNTISGNTAEKSGGGIFCYYSSPTITGNMISGNEADDLVGGGIYCEGSSPTITGNTITENTADNGGGIFLFSSSPTITNSILWGDSPDEIYRYSGTLIVNYSDIQGGWEGEGNIDEDPMFVLADKNDYRLFWESPCIDTGHPDSLDADGTRSDMGAHYFNQNDFLTLYMTPHTTQVTQGGQLGVTYTIINRWHQKEPFSALTRVTLPDGEVRTVLGPQDYNICPGYTAQIHLAYDIPPCAYIGMYKYQGAIGVPPSTLYDWDRFKFWITE